MQNLSLQIDANSQQVASTRPPPSPKSTPLLKALQAERSAAKDKETILKAHAHYRDVRAREVAASGKSHQGLGASTKKDDKRKAAGGKDKAEDQRAPAPTASPSKKTRKSRKTDAAAASTPAPAGTATKPTSSIPSSRPQTKPIVTKTPRAQGPPSSNTETDTNAMSAPKNSGKPSEQPQRARPTITLQSRQFEAALSGAIPRARREREASDRTAKYNAGADKEPVTPSVPNSTDAVGSGKSRRGGAHDRGSRRGGARSPSTPARPPNGM